MANILTVPESGIFFDGNTAGNAIVPVLETLRELQLNIMDLRVLRLIALPAELIILIDLALMVQMDVYLA